MQRSALTSIAAAMFILTASGCLVTSSNSVQESGVLVSRNTLAQIELGETSESWLIAALGEPTARTVVGDDVATQILRYAHTVRRHGDGSVFLIFSGHHDKTQSSNAFFEVREGVITRYWTEP